MPLRSILAVLLAASAASAQEREKVDLAVVHRIKHEAFMSGKVMDHLFWLTDANGPRLTNSPGWRSAAEWAVKTLGAWGASNPHLEAWGKFGRGWSMSRYSANLIEPTYAPLGGIPKAWSGPTDGVVRGELLLAPMFLRSERDQRRDIKKIDEHIKKFMEAWRGKLRGKIVLLEEARPVEPSKQLASQRFDEPKLAEEARAVEPMANVPYQWPLQSFPDDPKKRAAFFRSIPMEVLAEYSERARRVWYPFYEFMKSEGALATFATDDRGDGGLVFAESVATWEADAPVPVPAIVLAPEQYDRLARLIEKKVPAKVELEVAAQLKSDDLDGYNVVAELPGKKKRDEIVMLGAHLDSWHAGTGATDNAAGSAAVLEAFRILKALNLPLDRTVRIALWSGEEQGLMGSRGYVKTHFADPFKMEPKPEHAKLSAYFNLDNGGGKIRGIYLQDNDMARPIFETWLSPFKDLGAHTVSIRDTGGTDHLSFDAVGLPGFQFIQDPLDYSSRTHHSALDLADHVVPADLMQAAAIIASFVFNAANRPEMIPRKPLPPAIPPPQGK